MLRLDNLGIAIDPPGGNFPFGKLKNSNPLGSGNGSPAVSEWANDPIQMIYAALDHFGITISDVAEQVGDSDFVRILESVLPVGIMLPAGFTIDPATLDVRLLPCEGQTVSEATYAALFARIGTAYNTGGEPGGSFRLPETRGEYLRGFDNGRGIDIGRAFGSYQLDASQGHIHSLWSADFTGAVSDGLGNVATRYVTGEANASPSPAFYQAGVDGNYVSNPIDDGTNGVPRTSTETRVRGTTARYLIRY